MVKTERIKERFLCPCGCGNERGAMTTDGAFVRWTWKPFKEMYCQGTKYIFMRHWEHVRKLAPTQLEWHDNAGNTTYQITMEDAEKYGESWQFSNEPYHRMGHNDAAENGLIVWRIPRDKWEVVHG